MGRVRLALATGLTAMATALAVVLSHPPLTVAGTNGIPANFAVTFINGSEVRCQAGGTLPQGTTAIRVSLSANIGPRVNLRVLSGSTVVTEGERDTGWGVDETVTVPVRRVARTIPDLQICTTIGPAVEPIQVNGARVRTPTGGQVVLLRMEYLRPGPRSWLSLASSVARHMGIGHAPSGAWGAYAVIAVMIAVSALASRLVLRELK
jgi:hypothetical protein